MPEILRDVSNPQYVGRVTSALAGAQTIEEDVYLVDFPFDGDIIQVRTTFVIGSEILIGTHLLREYRLEIDFIRRTVVLKGVIIG